MDKKEMLILSTLRLNARESLTKISKDTDIPVSTVYERLKNYETRFIKKHTSIIDFNKLGFNTRVTIMLRAARDHREKLREHLLKDKSINSLYKINNGYDFMMEGIFSELRDVDNFLDKLESDFGVTERVVYYVVDELRREDFMSSPEYVRITGDIK